MESNRMEEESGRKRRRLQRDEEEEEKAAGDRISGLPDHLVHEILACLPTRIAVRTSLLSRRWRTVWTTFPDVSFTSRLSPSVFDSVLRLRDPAVPLRSFSLVTSDYVVSDRAYLPSRIRSIRRRVPSSTLKYLKIKTYTVPPAVFSLPCLRVLELAFPGEITRVDWPAAAFLPSLQRLELADLCLRLPAGDAISRSCPALKYCRLSLYIAASHKLDVSCPLLEVFEQTTRVKTAGNVSICGSSVREVRVRQELARSAPDYLKLSAPGLRTLEWLGPPPTAAAIDAADDLVSTLVMRTDNMFIRHDLTSMLLLNPGRGHTFSVLRVNRLILPKSCLTTVLGKLVFDQRNEINYSPDQEYENLKHLELTAYFRGFGSLGVAFLLKIFSKIETLHISLSQGCTKDSSQPEDFYNYFGGFGRGEYWDSHKFCLEKLIRISMHDFTGKEYEYDFLEFLFHMAISLRKVTISPDSQATISFPEEIFQKMEQLHLSFPHIKIVIS